jgi:predicted ATP-grasp superfamily ATP-dependent carboligase
MRILVYEHVMASGIATPPSLVVEARAMRDAVTADFAALAGCRVVLDPNEAHDAALLIAPETDGVLQRIVEQHERRGTSLLSPPSSFCAWAADKTRAAETLIAARVPMPKGVRLGPGNAWPRGFPLPAVLKPNDGCGSQGIILQEADAEIALDNHCCHRLEQFVSGRAVSIALLRGPAGVFPLPTCSQRLTHDGSFAYLGGMCPLAPPLAARAQNLALRAAAVMPPWQGYIGLDLVLGAADDGAEDFVIEVNPRLTTSYVGLRALATTNLARAMLEIVAGNCPQLEFRSCSVEFDAAGSVRYGKDEHAYSPLSTPSHVGR